MNIEFHLIRGQTSVRSHPINVRGQRLSDIENELRRVWGLNSDEKLRFQNPETRQNLNLVENEEPVKVFRSKGVKQVNVVCEQTAG